MGPGVMSDRIPVTPFGLMALAVEATIHRAAMNLVTLKFCGAGKTPRRTGRILR